MAQTANASATRHIALFGGSFDPPHLGHVLCATWAYVMGNVDEVWVLPVAEHAYHKNLGPWAERWALSHAAFDRLGFVRVRDDEQRNPGGYTFNLISTLRAAQPGWRWSLVGGSDTAADMGHWYRGAELRDLVEIIAVPRRGFDDDDAHAPLPELSSTSLRARLAAGQSWRQLVPPAVAELIAAQHLYGA